MACQYLVHAYIVKQYLIGSDQYLNNSYRFAILETGLAWIQNGIEIQNLLNSAEILGPNKKAAT